MVPEGPQYFAGVPVPLAGALQAEYPQLEQERRPLR